MEIDELRTYSRIYLIDGHGAVPTGIKSKIISLGENKAFTSPIGLGDSASYEGLIVAGAIRDAEWDVVADLLPASIDGFVSQHVLTSRYWDRIRESEWVRYGNYTTAQLHLERKIYAHVTGVNLREEEYYKRDIQIRKIDGRKRYPKQQDKRDLRWRQKRMEFNGGNVFQVYLASHNYISIHEYAVTLSDIVKGTGNYPSGKSLYVWLACRDKCEFTDDWANRRYWIKPRHRPPCIMAGAEGLEHVDLDAAYRVSHNYGTVPLRGGMGRELTRNEVDNYLERDALSKYLERMRSRGRSVCEWYDDNDVD